MDGGADDLVARQAPQPSHSLGEEGRKLAGACSACLRPHLAQSGGFRIESKAPETQPDHASMLLTSSAGSLPLSPRNTMSETAKRPPGFRTRNASEITLGLSVERLMTQLEITTST